MRHSLISRDYKTGISGSIFTNGKDYFWTYYGDVKSKVFPIICKMCKQKALVSKKYAEYCGECGAKAPKNRLKAPKVVEDKYINRHIHRHIPYNKMLKRVCRHLNGTSSGAVLTLPGSSPEADTMRLLKYYNNTNRFLWYENNPELVAMLRKNKKTYETIFGEEIVISLDSSNILKSTHNNIALANIDLECTMSIELMKDCLNIIKHGLKGRTTMGFILNTYGRGPKGMTLEKRDLLWNDFLDQTGCEIKYNSGRQGYSCAQKGPSGTMFLFGAVLSVAQTAQTAQTSQIKW